MKVLSLFSGGGGGDLGLIRAGHTLIAACEKEPHARAVLRHHHPTIPIYHDITEVTREQLATDHVHPDLIFGGTPCQDLSMAGGRAGLDGDKSRLFYEFVRVVDEIAPDWILWENVDGALSSNRGADFARVLGELTGHQPAVPGRWRSGGACRGPKRTVAWRVLDPRGVGVPQRRRRLFALGCVGALGAASVEVLFDAESCDRDSAPRRKTWAEDTGAVAVGTAAALSTGGGVSDHALALTVKHHGDLDSESFVMALDTNRGGVDDNTARAGHLLLQPRSCPPVAGRSATISRGERG